MVVVRSGWIGIALAASAVRAEQLASTPAWSAEGGQAGARLGTSVAPAGDVNGDGYADVIVGAPAHDGGETDEGSARVYLGSAAGLGTSPAWAIESDQVGAQLGAAVALAGDVNGDGYGDVIVGTPSFDGGLADEGRASVYLGSALGLAAGAAWTVEGEQAGAQLGGAVACAGDVNGDGFSDVLVGALAFDDGEADEGRAYLYLGSSAGLSATPAWTVSGDQIGAELGGAVACAGDVNGDGFADALVGARSFDAGEMDEGRAFLYLGSSAGLAATAAWTAESDQAGAAFGASLAPAGDVDGDGFGDVLVGAALHDAGEVDEGRAYLYLGSALRLAAVPAWTAEPDQAGARFGCAVSFAGDVNGDGKSDALVGARLHANGETGEGRVSLYLGSSAGLDPVPAWTAESDQAGAEFGNALAGAGDVDGDGYGDVLVGAHRWSAPELEEGAVFAYHGVPAGLATGPAWTAEGEQVGAYLGSSVASAGDVNGDGYGDVIVGAPGYDGSYEGTGRVLAYYGSAQGLPTSASWSVTGVVRYAAVGRAVASAGDVDGDGFGDVVVSSAYDIFGSVWLFRGKSSGLRTIPSWNASSNACDFGFSVASAGDVNGDGYGDVIIGGIGIFVGPGCAFVYLGSPAGLGASADWEVSGGGEFGHSVASAGDVNADGFSDVLVGTRQGNSAHVYLGSPSGPSLVPDWTATGTGFFGESVASAGDVNGDGYGDVIVGAPRFTLDPNCTPQCHHEGRAFVYLGSPSGLAAAPAWYADGVESQAFFGSSVASTDVNGDGYSDVLVGAELSGLDPPQAGAAYAFLGFPSGPALQPAWSVVGTTHAANLGCAIDGAGDVNGDGFGDVVVGARQYGNGQSAEGGAFVYLGNAGRGGRVHALQQRTRDDLRPLPFLGSTGGAGLFRLRAEFTGLAGHAWASPAPSLAFLEWEIEPLGTPFDGADLQRSLVGVPSGGSTVLDELAFLARGKRLGDRRAAAFAWRARVRTNNPLLPVSPWLSPQGSAWSEPKVRVLDERLR